MNAFEQHNLRVNNDALIDILQMIAVFITVFENAEYSQKDVINIPQCIDLTLNWMLNVYDR